MQTEQRLARAERRLMSMEQDNVALQLELRGMAYVLKIKQDEHDMSVRVRCGYLGWCGAKEGELQCQHPK